METDLQEIDPDEIMLKKKDDEKKDRASHLSSQETLTCWDLLNQTSSLLDACDRDNALGGIDANEALVKHKPKKPTVRPYISINDLNNSDDEPYLNKPKPAIEIGVTFDF